jgi:predicted  nucleic acid-binding Zn-ribbon protein
MSAPAMRPTPAQARILAELNRRVDALEKQQKALADANTELRLRCGDLVDQRDAARRTVGQQQDELSAVRPRQIRHPRPVTRDVPTGEAL